jgi:hypothetical protein
VIRTLLTDKWDGAFLSISLHFSFKVFDAQLSKGLSRLRDDAGTARSLLRRCGNYQRLGQLFDQTVTNLQQGHDPSDATFSQAVNAFQSAFEHFDITRVLAKNLAKLAVSSFSLF